MCKGNDTVMGQRDEASIAMPCMNIIHVPDERRTEVRATRKHILRRIKWVFFSGLKAIKRDG